MEKQLHHLENKVAKQAQTITKYEHINFQLEEEKNSLQNQIFRLKQKLGQHYPIEYKTNSSNIKIMQIKLAKVTFQFLQLQELCMNYQQQIKKLQNQLLLTNRTLLATQLELQSTSDENHQKSNQEDIVCLWKESLEEKSQLVAQNIHLKTELQNKSKQYQHQIQSIMTEMKTIVSKISQQQKEEVKEKQNMFSTLQQLQHENQRIQQELQEKNACIEEILLDTDGISVSQLSNMHTIRNLRKQIKTKSQSIDKMHKKIEEYELARKKYEEFNELLKKTNQEWIDITQNCFNLKQENQVLKEQLCEEQLKNKKINNNLHDEEHKLVQLLIENESCHRILYEVRGNSKIYKKDIEEKVAIFLKELEQRRNNNNSWRDISELIQVNRTLRIQAYDLNQQQ